MALMDPHALTGPQTLICERWEVSFKIWTARDNSIQRNPLSLIDVSLHIKTCTENMQLTGLHGRHVLETVTRKIKLRLCCAQVARPTQDLVF